MENDEDIIPIKEQNDCVLFADCGNGIFVIQIIGRANHILTPDFKSTVESIANKQCQQPEKYCVLFDMNQVETMDSTFMGTLAAFALRHKKETGSQLILCNVNEHCFQLLNTLGLKHFVSIRSMQDISISREQWHNVDKTNISKTDLTVMMLEAHETLCDIDSGNKVQFAGVLNFLRSSLESQNPGNSTPND